MGDSDNVEQPSRKRGALKQLSRENPGLDDEEDSVDLSGTFKKASDDVLASRRIVRVRRKEPSATPAAAPNPFAGITLAPATAPAPAPEPATAPAVVANAPVDESKLAPAEAVVEDIQKEIDTEEGDEVESKKVDVKESAEEETEKAKDAEGDKSAKADNNVDNNGAFNSFQYHSSTKNAFTGLASTEPSASSFSFGSVSQNSSTGTGSLFGFPLPNSNNSSLFTAPTTSLFGSKKSESTVFPPKQDVSTETGEENEKVAFSADSVIFEYLDGGWKERGKGELKVNISTNDGKGRLVMRSKGNYRLILNASLYPEMKLASMDKKGITFACVNSVSEGSKEGLSTFALKFKDTTIVEEFRVAVEKHKDSKPASVPLKTPENSPTETDA